MDKKLFSISSVSKENIQLISNILDHELLPKFSLNSKLKISAIVLGLVDLIRNNTIEGKPFDYSAIEKNEALILINVNLDVQTKEIQSKLNYLNNIDEKALKSIYKSILINKTLDTDNIRFIEKDLDYVQVIRNIKNVEGNIIWNLNTENTSSNLTLTITIPFPNPS